MLNTNMQDLAASKLYDQLSGTTALSIILILALFIYVMVWKFDIKLTGVIKKGAKGSVRHIGKTIKGKEERFNRNIDMGLINKKHKKYKVYRLFNELTIDLGLKKNGVTPYEFLFILMVISLVFSIVFGLLLFNNIILGFISYPIMLAGVICAAYTKANISHERRIEAVIEAENILSNNINNGIVVAVKDSLDSLPKELKTEFKDFLNDVEDNVYIVTALLNLSSKLGAVSDEFIGKCIKLMVNEDHGTTGMFRDVVELNNNKVLSRFKLKTALNKISNQVLIGTAVIMTTLICEIAIFADIRHLYFNVLGGQIAILIDFLLIIRLYVKITMIKSKEL